MSDEYPVFLEKTALLPIFEKGGCRFAYAAATNIMPNREQDSQRSANESDSYFNSFLQNAVNEEQTSAEQRKQMNEQVKSLKNRPDDPKKDILYTPDPDDEDDEDFEDASDYTMPDQKNHFSSVNDFFNQNQAEAERIRKEQEERAEELDLPERSEVPAPKATPKAAPLKNQETILPVMTESIEEIHKTFTPEQMAYINSEENKNKLVAQPQLGIHFNQIQDPYSVSDNVQLNKDMAKAKELEEQRRIEEEALEEQRRIEEEEAKKKDIEVLDETADEELKRKKRQREAVRRNTKKIPDTYPKTYFDPTDTEVDEDDGKEYYYFNIEKTLRMHNMLWITKFISLKKLEDKTFDNPKYDKIAQKQHDKAARLNAMDAYDQYERDIRIRNTKVGIVAGIILLLAMYINFSVIPNQKFQKAHDLMISRQYELAGQQFQAMGNYSASAVYQKYCEGKSFYNQEQWDEAKACFELLVDYQPYFDNIDNIQDLVYECDYQKGITLYSRGAYEDAKSIFRSIYKYSEATSYYYKCSYQIANAFYDDRNYFKAIDNFYEISKVDYDDSEKRLKDIAAQLYDDAQKNYDEKNYQIAMENFEFLASYSYLNSKDMINQCNYQYAVTLYDMGDYETAAEYFRYNPMYKDSNALAKECIYQTGRKTYNYNPVDAIAIYETIDGFKDATTLVQSNELVLYGRWNIVSMDNSQISPIEFSFYKDGLFLTQKQVQSVAISTAATSYGYQWNGNYFSLNTDGNTYKIEVIDNQVDKITIVCSNDETSHTYECERVYSYTDMLVNDNAVDENDNIEMNTQQKIRSLMHEYISKKTDGFVVLNGEEIDVNSIKIKMQDYIKQDNSFDADAQLPGNNINASPEDPQLPEGDPAQDNPDDGDLTISP